jgi:hypothetical protein
VYLHLPLRVTHPVALCLCVQDQLEPPTAEEASRRFAVLSLDWDRIKARDLLALFRSFAPAPGAVQSVVVRPSRFGRARMREEKRVGPPASVWRQPGTTAARHGNNRDDQGEGEGAGEENDDEDQEEHEEEDEDEDQDEHEDEDKDEDHEESDDDDEEEEESGDQEEEEEESGDEEEEEVAEEGGPGSGRRTTQRRGAPADDAAGATTTTTGEEDAVDIVQLRRYQIERLRYVLVLTHAL